MTTIDYNNAKLVDVFGCNGETYFCWVDNETGDVLREFNETDLETVSEYVELWDVGRETIVGAWVNENGEFLEFVDETTREAENELAIDDGFAFVF